MSILFLRYVSIIDVIEILTESENPRRYWSDLKIKLEKEGSQLSEKIGQLKMPALDGKMRMTDVADIEQLFRLIQSLGKKIISSLNAKSNKMIDNMDSEEENKK